MVDDRRGAATVRLHGKPQARGVPGGRVAQQCLDEFQRDLEAVLLLGVDGQRETPRGGEPCEFLCPRQQFGEGAPALQQRVARVERGELDGDPVTVLRCGDAAGAGDAACCRGRVRPRDGLDRAGVGVGITDSIGVRARAFAQHVEGAQRQRRIAAAALERLVDAASDDELAADDLHGAAQGLADDGLAGALREAAQPATGVAAPQLARQVDEAAGEHQPPGRGVHEQRVRAPRVGIPIAGGEFLRDQAVGRLVIRDAQQCLGEAHEGDPFLVGEAELLQEGVEVGALVGARAGAGDHGASGGKGGGAFRGGQGGQQVAKVVRLVAFRG